MAKSRPTLADVAARCGVTSMTASRALRAGTKVSPATRAAVEAAARELGYRADPFMSVLVNYRRNVTAPRLSATIGYVTNYPAGTAWRDWPVYRAYFDGASARAAELGYGLEEFSMSGAGSARRAGQIAHHRAYVGLLLAPTLSATGYTRLDVGQLPSVALGLSLRAPRLHYAASNGFRASHDLLHRLKKLGYRRPGYASVYKHDARTEHRSSAAFLCWQSLFVKPPDRVPCCLLPADTFPGEVVKWFKRWKPDVVVGPEVWPGLVLEKAGVRFPQDAGCASMGLHEGDDPRFSGMRSDHVGTGAAAIDLLHAQILRGEKGAPALPRGIFVDAIWNPGTTLKAK